MGVQFILFLGIDMGIGVLLARRTGILEPPAGRAASACPPSCWRRAASGALIALDALLCVMFGFAVAVFGVRITATCWASWAWPSASRC